MKSASIYLLIVLLSLGVISSAPAPANQANEAEATEPRISVVEVPKEIKNKNSPILSVDSAPDLVEAHVVSHETASFESTAPSNMSRRVGSIKEKCAEIEALLRERIDTDDRQQYTRSGR
tara:strand:+ start:8592 stop:8951 length:360 start_codon:yes stop_codon:yes gene_type:complete